MPKQKTKTMKKKNDFTIIKITSETAYLKDSNDNYYAMEYWYMDKSELRDYANVEPIETYLDEDGDLCCEYDDDLWDVDDDIIQAYINDYDKEYIDEEYTGDNDGVVFKIHDGDDWDDELQILLGNKK